MSDESPVFMTKTGIRFPAFPAESAELLRSKLELEYGLTKTQIAEAASYSMAMVVRFALGLSATEGQVAGLITDSLSSYVCLATLRHLVNAGASGTLFICVKPEEMTQDLKLQLKPLEKMGLTIEYWSGPQDFQKLAPRIESFHNILCGLYKDSKENYAHYAPLIEILNEARTPIHCVEAPIGLDLETGSPSASTLFASSTLSLGIPLNGLQRGSDYVGRHYLCDISIPKALYMEIGFDITALFAEQPVIQILPEKSDAGSAI